MFEQRDDLRRVPIHADESIDGHLVRDVHDALKGAFMRRDINGADCAASTLDRAGHARLIWHELFISLPELVIEVEPAAHFLRRQFEDWYCEIEGSGIPIEQSYKNISARVLLLNAVRYLAMTPRDIIRMVLIKNNAYYSEFTMNRPCVIELCEKYMDEVPHWVFSNVAAGGSKYGLVSLYAMAVLKNTPANVGKDFVALTTFLTEITSCLFEWGYCERMIEIVDAALQRSPKNTMATSLRWAWLQLQAGSRGFCRDRTLLVAMFESCIKTPVDEESVWSPSQYNHQLYRLRHSGSSGDIRLSGDGNDFREPPELIEWNTRNMLVWKESLFKEEDTIEYYGLNAQMGELPEYAKKRRLLPQERFQRRYAGLTMEMGVIHDYLVRYEMGASADPRFKPGVRHRMRVIQTKIAAGKKLVPQINRQNWRSSGRIVKYDRFKENSETIGMRMTFFSNIFERNPQFQLFMLPNKERDEVLEAKEWDGSMVAESYYLKANKGVGCSNRKTIPSVVVIPGILKTDLPIRCFRRINLLKEMFDPSGLILPYYHWSTHRTTVNGEKHFLTVDSIINEAPAVIENLTVDFVEVRKPQMSAIIIFRYLAGQPIFLPNVIYECREGVEEQTKHYLYTRDDMINYKPDECRIDPDFIKPIMACLEKEREIDEGLRDWAQRIKSTNLPEYVHSLAKKRLDELLPISHKERIRKILTFGFK